MSHKIFKTKINENGIKQDIKTLLLVKKNNTFSLRFLFEHSHMLYNISNVFYRVIPEFAGVSCLLPFPRFYKNVKFWQPLFQHFLTLALVLSRGGGYHPSRIFPCRPKTKNYVT